MSCTTTACRPARASTPRCHNANPRLLTLPPSLPRSPLFRPAQQALLSPARYTRVRGTLACVSHVVHKVAQTLVTVWPGVGTLHAGERERGGSVTTVALLLLCGGWVQV